MTLVIYVDKFSPASFPNGTVLFDISVTQRNSLPVESFPFELNRIPQIILFVADGNSIVSPHRSDVPVPSAAENEVTYASLVSEFSEHTVQYPRALLRQLLIFDYVPEKPEKDVICVPPRSGDVISLAKSLMREVTARFLASLDELAKSIGNAANLDSPQIQPIPQVRKFADDVAERVRQRMSMPSPSSTASSPVASRASSLAIGRSTSPALGAKDELGRRESPVSSPQDTQRPSLPASRSTSMNRQSLAITIPSSSNDAQQVKVAGRQAVIMGNLYLQAGLWPSALEHLAEGINITRSSGDYIWHARALEALLAAMMLLSWSQISYQIPKGSLPTADRPLAGIGRNGSDFNPPPSPTFVGPRSEAGYEDLNRAVPNVLHTIMTLYTRASNNSSDRLPPLMLGEAKVRAAHLKTIIGLNGGYLSKAVLDHLVTGTALTLRSDTPTLRATQKDEILSLLMSAIPDPRELMPRDMITLLVGVASVLAKIAMDRKQAFVLSQLLTMLIPAIVEARKVGAAEVGIHPAAGLSALATATNERSNVPSGLRVFLSLAAGMYGVPFHTDSDIETYDGPSTVPLEATNATAVALQFERQAQSSTYGAPVLKHEILRSCITISEALPDFSGVVSFTTALLSTARGATTLPPLYGHGPPSITAEEQMRLISNMRRALSAAHRLGMPDLQARYWDEFLVRSVSVMQVRGAQRISSHPASDLLAVGAAVEEAKSGKKDPFIYNPFAKAKKGDEASVLVAGDLVHFEVMLQNVFEVDVDVDEIALVAEGCDFEAQTHSMVVGPYSSQNFVLSGTPRKEGTIRVLGCEAKIRGCYKRKFLIYKEGWEPKVIGKTRTKRRIAQNP